jgi:hypothetical protein
LQDSRIFCTLQAAHAPVHAIIFSPSFGFALYVAFVQCLCGLPLLQPDWAFLLLLESLLQSEQQAGQLT